MISNSRGRILLTSAIGASCIGALLCSGCNSDPSQDPAQTVQTVPSTGGGVPSPEQQAQIIQNIQNSPNLPEDAKASAIAAYKQAMQTKQQQSASGIQTAPPSASDLATTIQQIENSPSIPAADKATIVAQLKQQMH